MLAVVVTSVLAFAATNVDDFLTLLLLYAAGGRPDPVVLGQLVGFGAIVAASFVVALGALAAREAWMASSACCRSAWASASFSVGVGPWTTPAALPRLA